ncbi:hypothetical protein OZ668_10915 [Elizabethkingia sp. HX XZB]|uniref:hypothetical protein n=1 Tax=Elizabethkingia sp. HX XZB TaxID=3003193 RepID=UPI002A24ACB5|nr:hypothetical protein [Elizabethkingia sp. HX XZB]MDX8568502.1 hypothetical protein [Elizabethkingia sp. HX XZB]
MKKFLSIFLLISSLILFAQKSELYSSYKLYDYGTIEDAEIIKMKTENYLRALINSGYKISKNEITKSKIDINFIYPIKGIDNLKANIVYEFDKYGYSAALYFPKMYLKDKKKWIDLDESDPNMNKIIKILEDIVYKNYQTDINSNF